jgi:hypothetical protein
MRCRHTPGRGRADGLQDELRGLQAAPVLQIPAGTLNRSRAGTRSTSLFVTPQELVELNLEADRKTVAQDPLRQLARGQTPSW